MSLEEISIVLWYIFFAFSIIFAIFMVWKSIREEMTRSQREYYLGVGIFVIVHLIARIFYFIYDFYGNDQFWDIAAIVGMAGILVWMYAIERHVFTRSYFIFTIIVAIAVILLIVLPDDNMKTTVQTVVVPSVGLFIPSIYLYVAYKGTGNIRKYSLIIFLGIMIFLAGQTAHMSSFLEVSPFIYFILSPIFMIGGGIIFLYGLAHT